MAPIPDFHPPKGESPPDDPDLAKAIVLAEFTRLVFEGRAVMATLEAGTVEVRLATGEIFHLKEKTVSRIA